MVKCFDNSKKKKTAFLSRKRRFPKQFWVGASDGTLAVAEGAASSDLANTATQQQAERDQLVIQQLQQQVVFLQSELAQQKQQSHNNSHHPDSLTAVDDQMSVSIQKDAAPFKLSSPSGTKAHTTLERKTSESTVITDVSKTIAIRDHPLYQQMAARNKELEEQCQTMHSQRQDATTNVQQLQDRVDELQNKELQQAQELQTLRQDAAANVQQLQARIEELQTKGLQQTQELESLKQARSQKIASLETTLLQQKARHDETVREAEANCSSLQTKLESKQRQLGKLQEAVENWEAKYIQSEKRGRRAEEKYKRRKQQQPHSASKTKLSFDPRKLSHSTPSRSSRPITYDGQSLQLTVRNKRGHRTTMVMDSPPHE